MTEREKNDVTETRYDKINVSEQARREKDLN